MPGTEQRFVPCLIDYGGFSSERTFTIPLPNGEALVGTAHVMYLRDEDGGQLPKDVPGYGEQIKGFVQCHVVRGPERPGDEAIVEVPSADLIRVSMDELATLR